MTDATSAAPGLPDTMVSARALFGFDTDLEVPAYSKPEDHVPDLDPDYLFDKPTTLAILAGFAHNGASWCRAIMAPASRPISSRSPPA